MWTCFITKEAGSSKSLNDQVKCCGHQEKLGHFNWGSGKHQEDVMSEWAFSVSRLRGRRKEEGTVGEGHSQGDEMV